MPFSHVWQAWALVSANIPAWHGPHAVRVGIESIPGSHLRQFALPGLFWYVPDGHEVHDPSLFASVAVALYLPAAHAWHVLAVASATCPGLQQLDSFLQSVLV